MRECNVTIALLSVVGRGWVSKIKVATRCSRIYLSTWSSMSEFPREEDGCPGPEAWDVDVNTQKENVHIDNVIH
jgi:hypothetical protein